jgi:DeoR family transcriptional regulator, suf operon transcriptional repressor
MNSLTIPPAPIDLIPGPVATGTTKEEILEILLKQGKTNAQNLANILQISPQAIRRHLKDLEFEGLIHTSEASKNSDKNLPKSSHQRKELSKDLGRPQHFYQLSQLGRDRLPKSYDRFALDLLSSLLNTLDKEQAAQVLGKQWQNKGIQYRHELGKGSLQNRLENLASLRRVEGYVTEWYAIANESEKTTEKTEETEKTNNAEKTKKSELINENSEAFIFTEYNCAIAQIAASHPNICTHELAMFSTALPDCEVERTHWMIEGEHHCGYLIRPKN